MFIIPPEERAFKDGKFGIRDQNEQMKQCKIIQKNTDTTIEISNCKDGSLSVLVSGRNDNVLQARREIYSKLQTKVKLFVLMVYFEFSNSCKSIKLIKNILTFI